MGVTLRSKNYSIDLGNFGFYNLRRRVAELVSPEMGEHYEKIGHVPIFSNREEEAAWWKEYDTETERIANALPQNVWKVIDFLYEPDCDGSISYGTCKQILKVVGDYDDNVLYGYTGRPDCAKFVDFKLIVEDCVKNRCALRWM